MERGREEGREKEKFWKRVMSQWRTCVIAVALRLTLGCWLLPLSLSGNYFQCAVAALVMLHVALGHTTTKATRTKRNGTKWNILARSVTKERTTGSAQLELVTRVFASLLGIVRCLINNNGGKRDRAHALFRRPRLTSTWYYNSSSSSSLIFQGQARFNRSLIQVELASAAAATGVFLLQVPTTSH